MLNLKLSSKYCFPCFKINTPNAENYIGEHLDFKIYWKCVMGITFCPPYCAASSWKLRGKRLIPRADAQKMVSMIIKVFFTFSPNLDRNCMVVGNSSEKCDTNFPVQVKHAPRPSLMAPWIGVTCWKNLSIALINRENPVVYSQICTFP